MSPFWLPSSFWQSEFKLTSAERSKLWKLLLNTHTHKSMTRFLYFLIKCRRRLCKICRQGASRLAPRKLCLPAEQLYVSLVIGSLFSCPMIDEWNRKAFNQMRRFTRNDASSTQQTRIGPLDNACLDKYSIVCALRSEYVRVQLCL